MANGTGYGGRGGSPVWIVIFVITTLVFMGTTYFCFKLYQDQRDAVSRLQDDIKTSIEDPLRQKGINAPTQDPVANHGIRYGRSFFDSAGTVVTDGTYMGDIKKLLGISNDPKKLVQILTKHIQTARLPNWPAEAGLSKAKLTGYQSFDGMLRAYELRLREYDKALREALANRDTMQKDWKNMRAQLEQQRRDKDTQIARIERELKKTIQERDRLRAKLEAEMAKVEKSRKQVWAMLQKEKDAHQKDLADLNSKVKELQATVAELRRKKAPPKHPKQYDGQVVRSELRYGFAYLDIGKKDGVNIGDHFLVYELGNAGRKVFKGELEVKKVYDKVCYAGIIEGNELNPIVEGDYVIRPQQLARILPSSAVAPAAGKAKAAAKKEKKTEKIEGLEE